MKNIIQNIMKVADVCESNISQETRNFLYDICESEYTDHQLQEHLYSLENIVDKLNDDLESIWGFVPDSKIKKEIEDIKKQMDKKDCAYLRITFM